MTSSQLSPGRRVAVVEGSHTFVLTGLSDSLQGHSSVDCLTCRSRVCDRSLLPDVNVQLHLAAVRHACLTAGPRRDRALAKLDLRRRCRVEIAAVDRALVREVRLDTGEDPEPNWTLLTEGALRYIEVSAGEHLSGIAGLREIDPGLVAQTRATARRNVLVLEEAICLAAGDGDAGVTSELVMLRVLREAFLGPTPS